MPSKQQTTALFLSTIVKRTRRQTILTKKPDKPEGKIVLCQRTFSSVFIVVFYTVKLHSLTQSVWGHLQISMVGPAAPLNQQASFVVISAPHNIAAKLRM